ncbi:hypothetical protein BDN72DRAFT_563178 [Pluteus cervinus]|uniref:Uncharacterized protein n=1 Tax=Pluteus cervinus TaxID=181527 RepID=A0ACD3BAU8_9AGAR|nr:hypothetical protein BDN72DRAFT_563178 [Pluteus cervinus]
MTQLSCRTRVAWWDDAQVPMLKRLLLIEDITPLQPNCFLVVSYQSIRQSVQREQLRIAIYARLILVFDLWGSPTRRNQKKDFLELNQTTQCEKKCMQLELVVRRRSMDWSLNYTADFSRHLPSSQVHAVQVSWPTRTEGFWPFDGWSCQNPPKILEVEQRCLRPLASSNESGKIADPGSRTKELRAPRARTRSSRIVTGLAEWR